MSELTLLFSRFYEYSLAWKGNSKETIRWLKGNLRSFQKSADIERLQDVNRQVVEAWIIKKKLNSDWSPKSIVSGLQAVSLFLDWCVDQGLIEVNFVKGMRRPKLPKSIPKFLSKEEAIKLLDWAEHFPYGYKFERCRATAIIATFIFTGIRLAELHNLKMTHVDLVGRTLLVKSGKGDKDRIIPLNFTLIPFLDTYLKERKRLKKTCPHFFTSMKYDGPMGDKVVRRLVTKLRERSKIYFYPHLLRHTFATLMLEGGCDLFSLSKMMGHSDIKTTTIYLSATTGHLLEQIRKHPLTL